MVLPAPARLTDLELVIERGPATLVEVGQALMEIRESRLYRETHPTFEGYCQERWGWSRRYANLHIQAAEVAGALGTIVPNDGDVAGTILPLPTSESVARELAPIVEAPEQRYLR